MSRFQSSHAVTQRDHQIGQVQDQSRDLSRETWLNTADAARYVGRPSRAAFRIWARRRQIVIVDGMVARRDIDAALRVKADQLLRRVI